MSSTPCPEGFSSADACRLTGCTNNQLRYWDRTGLVSPSIRGTDGKAGVRRCYAFSDLVTMRSIKALLDAGVSLQRIGRAFAHLRAHGLDDALGQRLVLDGDRLLARDDANGIVVDTLRKGQLVFFEVLENAATTAPATVLHFERDRDALTRAIRAAERDLRPSGRRGRGAAVRHA